MKSWFGSKMFYSVRTLGVCALVFACLWTISSLLGVRIDATREKFFTLSPGAENLLGKLEGDVTGKFYFSRSVKGIPVPVKGYATRVEELLRQFADRSRGRLTVEVFDPKPDSDAETDARRYGIRAVPLGDGSEMYLGVAFFRGSKVSQVPFLDLRREEHLEYDIAEALAALQSKEKSRVGLLSTLGAVPDAPVFDMQAVLQGRGEWAFVSELRKVADVEVIKPDAKALPDKLKLLILHHPKHLGEEMLRAIDQFVLKGGRCIVLVDPLSRVDLDRMSQTQGMQAMMGQGEAPSSQLKELFASWDVEFDNTRLVGDRKAATQINVGGTAMLYPFFLSLGDSMISRDSVVTSQLRQILLPEAGSLSLKAGSSYKFTPLLFTSEASGTTLADQARMSPELANRNFGVESKSYTLAALVQGKFKSAFAPKEGAGEWLKEAAQESLVLVVADADFIADRNSVRRMAFGNQIIAQPLNENLAFLVNAADLLSGNEDLIAIRSRGRFSRPFEKLTELQDRAQRRWKSEEDTLQAKLSQAQAKINEMQGARVEGNRLVLSAQQQAEVDRFRSEEAETRRRLREVRKNLREEIESLGNRLAVANLVVVPCGVACVGFWVFHRRGRKGRRA